METLDCIKTRRSVRTFNGEPIAQETICKIVEAASYAPSWKNTQIVRYTVLQERNDIENLASQGMTRFPHNAKITLNSAVIAVQTAVTGICGFEADGSYTTDKEDGWQMYDAGISAQTFCLAAHEHGIGTVIMGIFEEDRIRELLQIPDNETVTAVIAMGYPVESDEPARVPKRKSVEEILRFF